jgi:AraC family transcriptional regulator
MKKETLKKRTNISNDIMYYIYTHIDTHIDIEELSIDLKISKFHMQRIFKAAFGRNIYETIKSIRLQKASNLLLTNKYSTISEIAKECGYSSQSSFIKSFKNRFDMTPKQWRLGGYKEYSSNILQQSAVAMQSKADFTKLHYEVVKMPELKSYYIRNKGYNVNIKESWQKLQAWTLSNEVENYNQIALFHDNPTITPLNDCQYIACINTLENSSIQSDRLPKFSIASGLYAKFDLEGVYGDVLKFIHWVYHEWLPQNEYETTTKPPYAIYHKNNFLSADSRFELSFYLPIKF